MRFIQKTVPVLLALIIGGCVSAQKDYTTEEKGSTTMRSLFQSKKEAAATQWAFANEAWEKGNRVSAGNRMLYLYRRWPNSKEAPLAARARADIYFERGKWKKAFTAYQYLIDTYPSRMDAYDEVLARQFDISVKIMERKKMRWMFGGYKTPEYAVKYFEDVVRNGPQWSRAPEAQFMAGKCNQDAKQYDEAISAYGVLGYRYPDSSYAEEAAWQQIVSLSMLRKDYPNSPEILDRMLTSTTVFLSTYPRSAHRDEIIGMRNRLYEVKAGRVFDEAAFYAKVPKEPKAAIIYYEKMIEEYPKSRLVPDAELRIVELKELMAKPIQARTPDIPRSKPLPFTKGSENVES